MAFLGVEGINLGGGVQDEEFECGRAVSVVGGLEVSVFVLVA